MNFLKLCISRKAILEHFTDFKCKCLRNKQRVGGISGKRSGIEEREEVAGGPGKYSLDK